MVTRKPPVPILGASALLELSIGHLPVLVFEGATVVHLLRARSPLAVPRFVVSVVVDAFYRKFRRWLRSHVGQEVLEAFQPTVANGNPAPPVRFKAFFFGIVATSSNVHPAAVFRSPLTDTVMSVAQVVWFFALQAATTPSPSARQFSFGVIFNRPAIAYAQESALDASGFLIKSDGD